MEIRKLILTVVLFVIFSVALFWFEPAKKGRVIRLCTWSDYLDESILKEFEKRHGISVSVSYFSSNEELLSKLRAGAKEYDLIQPSDYMVRQMIRANLLLPMDHRLLPNLSHLDEAAKELIYDPGLKYSMPFALGTTGISVNTEKVEIPREGMSWKYFLDNPHMRQESLLDDMREVVGIFFIQQWGNPNIKDEASLETVFSRLKNTKRRILMFTSEPRALLLKGELWMAHIFSVDGLRAQKDDPKIKYFIPVEGATRWTDNFAIPKEAMNPSDAHLFLNYLLEPEVAAKVSMQNMLATPNLSAKKMLPESVLKDPNFYPPPEIEKKLIFLDPSEDTLPQLERQWTEMKSAG